MSNYIGKTIVLYSITGGGKTQQAGEYAKYVGQTRKLRSRYFGSDMGGTGTIDHLFDAGLIDPVIFDPELDDPWIWINNAVTGGRNLSNIGLVIFDSATSQAELILDAITKTNEQIGQQKTQKFVVKKGKENLSVGLNNEAHYGLVQSFMRDMLWKSTWLSRKGIDVLWNFSLFKGEGVDSPVLGPLLAGKALTAAIPKWFNYTFMLDLIPVEGEQARHVLNLAPQPELMGTGFSFSNARYPIDATTSLPASIEPASLPEAFRLIELGYSEAAANLSNNSDFDFLKGI